MKNYTRHLLSMTAAAAIGCSAVLNSGLPAALQAAAYDAAEAGKLVPVIVRLSGEAVLAGAEAAALGTDYLDTADAVSKAETLRQISSEAEAELRSLYPELEIGYRYELLTNGFSCELPADLLDEAAACSLVDSITKVETMHVLKPELYTAPEVGEVSFFGETTGYFGEGEVIAVLDSEFDTTHSMFAPIDDKENKLTKEDIAAVAGELNVSVDPEMAYVSSKLPFVIDYADDTPYEYAVPEEYHGTHVAGIAAGNQISGEEGAELSGIARDAQLVLMKVFDHIVLDEETGMYMTNLDTNVLLAALEDTAKLKVDVVNLSLGSPDPDLDSVPYKDTLTALNNAGIVVVAAAGNDSNNYIEQGVFLDMDPSVPDTHTVGEPSAFRDAFCVASANNSFRRDPCFRIEGLDGEIPYCDAENCTFSDSLSDDVYEYVYCGLGTFEDFIDKDLTGKIALIDRGDIEFWEKAYNAEQAGAIAMIVCDNVEDSMLMTMMLNGSTFPSVFISMDDGNQMKTAESGKLRLDSTVTVVSPLDGGINEFSSFGPAGDLTLKPDIAGIGGSVSSAGYDNKLKQMSGTSMATPYVAGCAAVFDQYLRKNGIELTGMEKTDFIKSIMMNAATLFPDGDGYESPRRQGAGLVNMKNVLNDRVILTNESGLAKIELKDNLTDQIRFDVDIRNFTDQDVTFTEANLILSAEDCAPVEGDESGRLAISGASPIGVTADLSSLLHADANKTRTVQISAQLSADDLAAHSENFPNGFFVEGYLMLSGAENCCDISIPVMGFYGDWAQVPIFHNGLNNLAPYVFYTVEGENVLDASNSIAGTAEALCGLIGRIPADELDTALSDPFNLPQYYDAEFLDTLAECEQEGAYLSPDGDGMAENVGILFSLLRSAHLSGIKIYDIDNQLVAESEEEIALSAHSDLFNFSEAQISDLPDGKYRGEIEAYVYYPGAMEHPQKLEFPIVIDKTAPELSLTTKEENGRKLLTITCTDENLDGIYIMGKGSGGIAGEYTADSPQLAEMNYFNLAFSSRSFPMYGFENPCHADSIVTKMLMYSLDSYEQEFVSALDFSDILPAYRYQDADGVMSVTYDVTDLETYMVTAMDKAFNATEETSEGTDLSHLNTGLWWAKNGGDADAYYNFWDSNEGNIFYQSGAPEQRFTFTQNGDTVTMIIDSGSESVTRTGTIAFPEKQYAEIAWDDGVTEKLTYANPDGAAGFDYITTPEMKEIVTAHYNAESRIKAVSAEVTYDEEGLGIVRLLDADGKELAVYTGFDRFQNAAVDPDGKDVQFTYIRPGVYRVYSDPDTDAKHYYILYTADGNAVMYSAEDGKEWERTVEYNDSTIICNKDKADEMSAAAEYDSISMITVTMDSGNTYYLSYDPNVTAEDFHVYTISELKEMAADYCERTMGKRPETATEFFDDEGRYFMQFSDGQGLSVDPVGAEGFDMKGYDVDLTALPEIRDLFRKGTWLCQTDAGNYCYFSSDGNGNLTIVDKVTGSEETVQYHWIGSRAVELTSGDQTETAFAFPFDTDDVFTLERTGHPEEMMIYINEETIDRTGYYTDAQIAEMAAADRSQKTGKTVTVRGTTDLQGGSLQIQFDDGSEYIIDQITGVGTDADSNPVILPQTGNHDRSTAAAAAGSVVLMMLGAAAVYASGVLRRKEKC